MFYNFKTNFTLLRAQQFEFGVSIVESLANHRSKEEIVTIFMVWTAKYLCKRQRKEGTARCRIELSVSVLFEESLKSKKSENSENNEREQRESLSLCGQSSESLPILPVGHFSLYFSLGTKAYKGRGNIWRNSRRNEERLGTKRGDGNCENSRGYGIWVRNQVTPTEKKSMV